MTPRAIELLRALVIADRTFHSRRETGELVNCDDRGIEISRVINGFDMRTAEQLVKHGLAEIVNIRGRQNYIFLGKYEPYDEEAPHD